MTTTQAPKTRKPVARFARLFDYTTSLVLGITDARDTVFYTLTPLPSDFGRAFRLTKAERGNGPEESYDVCLMDGGRSTCECLGHLKHGHRTVCKHISALSVLLKAGILPRAKKQTTPRKVQGQPAEACQLDDL